MKDLQPPEDITLYEFLVSIDPGHLVNDAVSVPNGPGIPQRTDNTIFENFSAKGWKPFLRKGSSFLLVICAQVLFGGKTGGIVC